MPRITVQQAGSSNRTAFLDMLAVSEIGAPLLANPVTDDGYRCLVGSTPAKPLTFASYAAAPNVLNKALNSTAAGRYQTLHRYAAAYMQSLRLPDFSPVSQDLIALQQIREKGALPFIDIGNLQKAIQMCACLWASLPGNDYLQHANSLTMLEQAYLGAGGNLV